MRNSNFLALVKRGEFGPGLKLFVETALTNIEGAWYKAGAQTKAEQFVCWVQEMEMEHETEAKPAPLKGTNDIGPWLDENYKDSPFYQAECAKNDADADALRGEGVIMGNTQVWVGIRENATKEDLKKVIFKQAAKIEELISGKEPGMSKWKQYQRASLAELRPYIPGEDLSGVSVSDVDTPGPGGMIARNPNNHKDKWYVAKNYFCKNFRGPHE